MQRLILSIGICLLFTSCAQNEHFNRGYVISKSNLDEEPELSDEEKAPSSPDKINP